MQSLEKPNARVPQSEVLTDRGLAVSVSLMTSKYYLLSKESPGGPPTTRVGETSLASTSEYYLVDHQWW